MQKGDMIFFSREKALQKESKQRGFYVSCRVRQQGPPGPTGRAAIPQGLQVLGKHVPGPPQHDPLLLLRHKEDCPAADPPHKHQRIPRSLRPQFHQALMIVSLRTSAGVHHSNPPRIINLR